MKCHLVCWRELWLLAQLTLLACLAVEGATLKRKMREAPSFLQSDAEASSEAKMKNGPLFPVNVKYDWEKHDPAMGVTVMLNKQAAVTTLDMKAGISTEGQDVAWGYLKDDLSKNGWIKLFLQTSLSPGISNDVKVYGAGFIEGMLTAVRISQFYSNFFQTIMKSETNSQALSVIRKVFEDELEFVRKNGNIVAGVMTDAQEPRDPYWKNMRYQYIQLWALKDGYNFVAAAKGVRMLDLIDFMVINSHAELPELMMAYSLEALTKRKHFQQTPLAEEASLLQSGPNASHAGARGGLRGAVPVSSPLPGNLTAQQVDDDWEKRLIKRGRCSGLVRLAPENKDLLVGHTTWGDYAKMTRIFKYYHIDLPGARVESTNIGFSSYPGCLSSTDDFYLLNRGLVVMDTSLEILNQAVYDRVAEFPKNAHVPDWMHVMTVNRMASTAPHWCSLFSEKNSGTDNAQWMIVDYNRFTSEKPVLDNTLWVLEQVPGIMMKADMSAWLRDKGYWASYNRPYFPKIRDLSGHTEAERQYGALYSYGAGPRATIFGNVAPLSEHLMDMRNIMNRNQWPNEGILPNQPGHAISARMDLSFSKIPNGGIDAKVVNRCLFRSMQCQAISGPTHDSQNVFTWREGVVQVMKGWPHLGLPDAWDFDWVQMTPTEQLNHIVDVTTCS